jgi:hypothetical protein
MEAKLLLLLLGKDKSSISKVLLAHSDDLFDLFDFDC